MIEVNSSSLYVLLPNQHSAQTTPAGLRVGTYSVHFNSILIHVPVSVWVKSTAAGTKYVYYKSKNFLQQCMEFTFTVCMKYMYV